MYFYLKSISNTLLTKCPNYQLYSQRGFWQWILNVFNKVDDQRVKEVGADRAAAEWLLKNGASVKWSGSNKWQTDYNSLPSGDRKSYKIEEIDATDSSIMYIGFAHLKDLKNVKKFIVKNNGYFDDRALSMLNFIENSLTHLEIISCIGVTDTGIISIKQLHELQVLKLLDLPSVKNREKCLITLNECLPKCTIDWDITKPKSLLK